MVNRICWQCGVTAHMSLPKIYRSVTSFSVYDKPTVWDFAFPVDERGLPQGEYLYVIYVCDECGYPNLAQYRCIPNPESNGVLLSKSPIQWIPSRAEDHQFSGVPENVAAAANEAFRCFSIQAYRASVIMARSVLEGIANEKISVPYKINSKGEKYDKTLKEKIEDMVKEEAISKKLGEKASLIKDVGNSSTHNIFEEITETDAAGTLGFLELTIQEVYTQEAQLQQLGKTVENIRQKKHRFWLK